MTWRGIFKEKQVFPGVEGNANASSSGFQGVGVIYFDPTDIPQGIDGFKERVITFEAALEVTTGLTGEIQLFNLDDGYAVTDTVLNTTSITPEKLSVELTPGTSVYFNNAETAYEVQIRISAGATGGANRVTCKSAEIVVTYQLPPGP